MPLFNSFPPPPSHSVGQSSYCLTSFGYLHRAFVQGNTIALASCMSPSVNNTTHILEDRPIGPYIFVSLTSLMSSLDHLRGVLSASRDGCFSRAQLQLHHCTVEIRTGYWSVQYLVKDPRCHLTLAHWWVYWGTQIGSFPLWFLGCVGDIVQKSH